MIKDSLADFIFNERAVCVKCKYYTSRSNKTCCNYGRKLLGYDFVAGIINYSKPKDCYKINDNGQCEHFESYFPPKPPQNQG